ncbi:hypothetical protein LTR35_014100 [Friedmanniomyces endolithicus]|uniref:Uncharacterized protein n=1 Tax=Friedmanniomyces endolithicus TaxID=329885 RepID=A0AAN6FK62_9PEZI|nr:hypothetical protein LTR35_014100 [Friedmanniomyces endolithicus]KAK0272449.1 hypothetical protein LTS00_016218 [Friedmanniomyces endolithicus]KAK0318095.1 hypothetical protein LTR82_010794 [Friedmanniomyces endolithicus]KAK1009899.1 hypothetical protein LTR54_005695 [Friedmanniomyces endolithicus]
MASGKESTNRTATETPSTYPAKDKDTANLLAVVVDHARSAEDGARRIRRMVDLAYRKHGLALLEDDHVRALMVDGATTALSRSTTKPGLVTATVRRGDISRCLQVLVDLIEDEHIAMMNVDGTLNWISASFSDELIQALNAAVVTSNGDAAKAPERLRKSPDSAPIPTGPAASRALPGSKCRRTRRGGRNHRKKADGTPKCISSSQGGETVQSRNAALAMSSNDAAGTPEPLQNRLETAQIFTTQSAPKADCFQSSRRLDFLIGMNR